MLALGYKNGVHIVETIKCPFCREEIKAGAIKCKHCGSTIVDVSQMQHCTEQKKDETLLLPLLSIIMGILCFLVSPYPALDADTFENLFILATTSFILGVTNINTQKKEKV